jgi:hypothetical protein
MTKKDARDYKQEYRDYHGKPKQRKERAMRNAARTKLGLKTGDPREVDHKHALSEGGTNSKRNLRAVSQGTNRHKAAKKSLDYSQIHTPRIGGSKVKDDELDRTDEDEEGLEKGGSDADKVQEMLNDESGGVEAYSQALESVQDPKLKEILQAIHEDETKHQAALEQWMQENDPAALEEHENEETPGEESAEDDESTEAGAEQDDGMSDEANEGDDDKPDDLDKDEAGDEGDKRDLIDAIRAVLAEHDKELDKADEAKPDEGDGDSDEDGEDDKEEDGTVAKSYQVPIIKGDQQVVYGVVSEPDTIDLQGDRLSKAEIRKACHKFMMESRKIGKEHQGPAKADIIESYIAPADFRCHGQVVKAGSWVMAVKIHDKDLWSAVKKGDITGFSIAGQGERVPFEA